LINIYLSIILIISTILSYNINDLSITQIVVSISTSSTHTLHLFSFLILSSSNHIEYVLIFIYLLSIYISITAAHSVEAFSLKLSMYLISHSFLCPIYAIKLTSISINVTYLFQISAIFNGLNSYLLLILIIFLLFYAF
jgi:hypothetical protein